MISPCKVVNLMADFFYPMTFFRACSCILKGQCHFWKDGKLSPCYKLIFIHVLTFVC